MLKGEASGHTHTEAMPCDRENIYLQGTEKSTEQILYVHLHMSE